MQISTWLTHPEVPCFNFSRDHADLLEDSIKGARVQICHSREEFAGSLATSEVVLVWTFEQEYHNVLFGKIHPLDRYLY